jgi:glutamine amidotransferase
MQNLNNLQIKDILNKKVLTDKTPVLGICLGMQLMTLGSEEGKLPGLGWIDAESVRFRFDVPSKFKSPHMGWNSVRLHKDSRLLKDMLPESRFYFVHSYYIRSNDPSDILTSTEYEREFTSSFERENIIGVQFHPEKSHKFGMALLKNFAELY